MDNDSIAFEKVSIAEARAALRGPDGKSLEEPKWDEQRKPPIPSDVALQRETYDWLVAMPDRIRPHHLAQQFPRIANKIFSAWKRPEICIKVFDELMMDNRGTRKGFPLEVAREITNLRVYYTTEVFKMKQDTWVLTA